MVAQQLIAQVAGALDARIVDRDDRIAGSQAGCRRRAAAVEPCYQHTKWHATLLEGAGRRKACLLLAMCEILAHNPAAKPAENATPQAYNESPTQEPYERCPSSESHHCSIDTNCLAAILLLG